MGLAALISAILAFICFFLTLIGISVENIDLMVLGWCFLALAFVFGHWPVHGFRR